MSFLGLMTVRAHEVVVREWDLRCVEARDERDSETVRANKLAADVKSEHWAFAESVGGVGFRPSAYGSIRSVLFDSELPSGWKKIGTEKGKTEATPRKTSKAGKAFAEQISALPNNPKPESLAGALGYSPKAMPMYTERGTIYFPTAMHIAFPVDRYFVRLPRFANDGFEPDTTISRALPESEFMKAIEDHNAEARRLREMQPA